MPWVQTHFPRKILATAQNLSVDLVTAEVVGALRARRVRSILLKGPTLTTLLYRDGEPRTYVDVDLLIAQRDAAHAGEVLLELGFAYGFESRDCGPSPDRVLWMRPPDEVDLHHTLQGVEADAGRLWSVLSGMTGLQEVGGQEVEILSEPARALHVALHATQHGRDWKVPMEDLRRAIEILPLETWQAAARGAEQVEAAAAFATGLRLLPTGELLAERLGLSARATVGTLLRSQSPPHLTLGFEKLYSVRGPGAKVRFIARKLFPPRANMRFMMPLAQRGWLGLATAYLVRLGWLARHFNRGFRVWMRARREAGGR
jgi:putative nucleotidyltransferase-like protein